ncbi:MAG: pilus assembly protein PilM [Lachnospiraceae bacterium]|nr:pilus assembly protein PilM [Lachnospiraceae bacterium]
MASKILSIELSNTTIRIVQMDYKTTNPRVYYHVVCNTPENSINDGYLINPDAVANAIRTALVSNRIKGTKNVIFTISSTKIVTREQQLPQMKAAQLDSMIQTNLSDYFPIDLDNYQVAYTVLGTIDEGKDAGKLRVSIMAAENNLVESYKQLASSCGLQLVQVDNVANSVYQVLKSENKTQCKMVLKIEENATSVLVIKNESLLLQRNIGFGFLPAIKEIMHQPAFQAVSEFDARNIAMKRACIRKTLNEATAITDSEDMPEPSEGQAMTNARQAVTDSLEDLVKGIQRVINYYNSTNSSNPLDLCYICGAGGAINGISHLLSNELGLKVSVLRKLENVSYSVLGDNADLYNYVASIGAIYAPVGFFSRAKANKGKNAGLYGKIAPWLVVASIVVAGALVGKAALDFKDAKEENDNLKITEARYKESEAIYKKYAAVLDFYNEVLAGQAATTRTTDNIGRFLKELEKKMPSDMNIVKFTSNDEEFTMVINVLDKNTAIGIYETLREFDSIDSLMSSKVEEVEVTLDQDEVERLGLDELDIPEIVEEDEEEDKADKDKDDIEEGVVAISTPQAETEEDAFVTQTGTIYKKYDFENEEYYYIIKYVEFEVVCVYAPEELVLEESNVVVEEEEGAN